MGPHKDPSKLPVGDQVKLLREQIDEVQWDTSAIKTKQHLQDDQLKLIRIDTKETNQTMKKLYKDMEKWKNDLHNLIDGFSGRIKSQDIEIAAVGTRSQDHETRISKIEGKGYNPAAA